MSTFKAIVIEKSDSGQAVSLTDFDEAKLMEGEIAKLVWGHDDAVAREVVRVTLHRPRRKIGDDAASPRLIHAVPGVGVRLRPNTS